MTKKKTVHYVCDDCGYESPKWLGKCPACQAWGTLREFKEARIKASAPLLPTAGQYQAQKLSSIKTQAIPRQTTNMQELDRVLGGGIVPGSLVLIGGDPGIGKSTLLLQLSMLLHHVDRPVLYVSGEESAVQIKMRADRMAVGQADFYMLATTDLEAVIEAVETVQPTYLIIDSIQTMQHPGTTGVAGSVSQVRECTQVLMKLAKGRQIATFIVGHVTKEGNIAGPRLLEHMVDTVMYFEGEKYHAYRMLRAVKNRFGATNEIGVFEMNDGGLKEVLNPSEIFLEERLAGANGSAIVVSLEGTRPILAEIQSLITPTAFGNARRTTSGLDYNRVSLLMAVLEKRTGLFLQNQDAYFKSTGGVKLDEPAIDLAIAVALMSSYFEQETNFTDCFVGEIGLTGEIRRVTRITDRIKEAAKLGFKRIFIPNNNAEGLPEGLGIEVVPVATIQTVKHRLFPK